MAKRRRRKKVIEPQQDNSLQGSQRPIGDFGSTNNQRYGLEINDNPIREPYKARQLIEMREHSYIVSSTLTYAARDVFASTDGDDRGFTIGDYLTDGETEINPQIKEVALDLFARRNWDHVVIGGNRLQRAMQNVLAYGDCFFEIGIEKEGIGRNDYGVSNSLYLPTWEMFKVQTDQGITQRYEQRRTISQTEPDYCFEPWQIINFQHNQKRIYGRSLWHTSEHQTAWNKTREATEGLAIAAKDLGYNPNVHILPEGTTKEKMKQYKDAHKRHKMSGIITDYYLYSGTQLNKIANLNPSLAPLIENVLQKRIELVPPGMPLYYYPEFARKMTGSREISQQPALNYSRIRHSWCAILAEGIKKVIDIELVLKYGLEQFYQWQKEYRGNMYVIQFPIWTVNYFDNNDESDRPYQDLEQESENSNQQSRNLWAVR